MGAGPGTVLLVEDHDELRAMLCGLLESAGYTVVAASDGISALGVVAGWPIDLLVADVSMPRLAGVELARRLAVTRPGLKVLLISTNHLSDEDVAEAFPGPARFLAKPFTADELKRAVSEMLAAGPALDAVPAIPDNRIRPPVVIMASRECHAGRVRRPSYEQRTAPGPITRARTYRPTPPGRRTAEAAFSRQLSETSMVKSVVLNNVFGVPFLTLLGVLLFGCAGRWNLPLFWAYLGVWAAAIQAVALVADPTLLKERLRPGPGGKDYTTLVVVTPLWLGLHAVAGLDVGRFHWSGGVPLAFQVIGLLAVIAGMAVTVWAMAVNRYFSSVIRIQTDRGHHLVTSGPYAYVRHPFYACWPFLTIGAGLTLESWLAALIGLFLVFPILLRTAKEDRTLREQLEGYAAYAQKVRYRLLPGVW